MICVGGRRARHQPGFIPAKSVLIHEQSHQLGNCYRRVCVVKLHRPFFMKRRGFAAEQRMNTQHVLQ